MCHCDGNMEDFMAAGAHTITTGRIFLKQDKKARGQLDRNKKSEERRGPSREDWNFPQLCHVYVGLTGPYTEEKMLEKSVILLRFPFFDLPTGCPYCSLSVSFPSQCLPFSLPSLPPLFSHPRCADVCPEKEGINRPRGQAWETARFPSALPSHTLSTSPVMTQLFLFLDGSPEQ